MPQATPAQFLGALLKSARDITRKDRGLNVQVWGFLQENEITKAILDDLERRHPHCEQDADKTLSGQPQVGTTESENNGICYWVVKKCATGAKPRIEIEIGLGLTQESKYNDCIEGFRNTYVEPLFDYVNEAIDDKRMLLVLLKKFKHRCEWFYRAQLLSNSTTIPARAKKHWREDFTNTSATKVFSFT
jgi:hypothetical protein